MEPLYKGTPHNIIEALPILMNNIKMMSLMEMTGRRILPIPVRREARRGGGKCSNDREIVLRKWPIASTEADMSNAMTGMAFFYITITNGRINCPSDEIV